ncbi:ribose-5-phosphate isomerase RpiA [Candidatus Leptofilum sp.]|uniref:ribose-5-phosphate isomerase RpiA n=1 Tax=Candidatus Leptofilum sp. TaxID=3241576 RepID=UPI003B5A502D
MSADITELKRQAAEKAVEFVQSGMVVGLGTGSTAVHAVRAVGRLLKSGELQNIVAIPTSEATACEAESLQIPLVTFDEHPKVDITIDGADEIAPNLDVIKGLGGALLREKIVAAASRRFVIVADHTKRVPQLGSKAPVPVEVISFAEQPVSDYLESLGARVVKRMDEDGERPFRTDENNIILDCYLSPIVNPQQIAAAIRQQPGVVEHGLFLNMATDAVLATPDGIEHLTHE